MILFFSEFCLFAFRGLKFQIVQSLRSVQNVGNGWNGRYLLASGTCGVCVVCKEFSGSSRYKPKASTIGISFTEKRIASSLFDRLICSCQAQLGSAKESYFDHSSVLSPTMLAPSPPTTK